MRTTETLMRADAQNSPPGFRATTSEGEMTFLGTTNPLQQKLDFHRRATLNRNLDRGRIQVSALTSELERAQNMQSQTNSNANNTIADMLLVDKTDSIGSPMRQSQMA